ncbi:NrfD/PsrC family molybdoenzyme membrane anchor subunit, partial [Turicimonas muris]
MIELTSLTPQLQAAHWGWTIAIFLWLVGLAGMGFFLNYWIRQKNFVYVLTVSGIVGTLLVVSHLGRMLNLPIAVFSSLMDLALNLQSWMLIGICLLSILCIASVFYSFICAGIFFKGEKWQAMAQSDWFNGIFALLGVCCTIYSGFLLTQAVGISLWNTALIPLLWIMS